MDLAMPDETRMISMEIHKWAASLEVHYVHKPLKESC